MATQERSGKFIGREQEIQLFRRWLQDPDASKLLYFHDLTEDKEKKGGIGKTWLLRQYIGIVAQERPDIAVLMVDFFNVEDRDRLFLAEKVVKRLQDFCPSWSPSAFNDILEQYYSRKIEATLAKRASDMAEEETTFTAISAALVEDLQRLEPILEREKKTLLVMFDTFEVIENNPTIAVLRHLQMFPDTYGSAHMRCVMAGRNRLDWNHPNWRGRQDEVQVISLHPFSKEEMLAYIEAEAKYSLPPLDTMQIAALHKRTEGRPIMVGLVVDVLNNRIQPLNNLLAVAQENFEANLVQQINRLENPTNWAILFMAHAYHHFNIALLEQILSKVPQQEPMLPVDQAEMAQRLPQLSFVRRSSTDDSFVLHDEMRRLVVKYCWETLDPNKRQRKEISQCVIDYYQDLVNTQGEAWQQLCSVIILHHRLFIDLDDGLQFFIRRFQTASWIGKRVFARLLFQEMQDYIPHMSLAQRNDLQLCEAQLLSLEDEPDDALAVIARIRQKSDPQWYEENYYDVLSEEGRYYLKKNLWLDAERSLQECLEAETKRNNRLRCAALLNRLGYIARRRGQYNQAIASYQQSADLFKSLKKLPNYAGVLNNMSYAYRYQGKTEEALLRCRVGWRIRRKLFLLGEGDEVPVGRSLSTLGTIYLSANKISEAETLFEEAQDIYVRADSKIDIAATYNRFGHVQFARRNLDEALSWFVKAQDTAIEANIEHYITSLSWQGRVYMEQQRWTEAQTFFQRTIQRAQQVADNYQKAENLIYLAECLAAQKQEAEAQQVFQEAGQIANEGSYNELLGRIEFSRGEIIYHQNKFRLAFQHFVNYCRYMALYNYAEYSTALQRLINALMGVGDKDTEAIIEDILHYWREHHLDEEYPELITACEEARILL